MHNEEDSDEEYREDAVEDSADVIDIEDSAAGSRSMESRRAKGIPTVTTVRKQRKGGGQQESAVQLELSWREQLGPPPVKGIHRTP